MNTGSYWLSAMPFLVKHVPSNGIPTQIRKSIITANPIVVTRLLPVFRLTNERLQYETMHTDLYRLHPSPMKTYAPITSLFFNNWPQYITAISMAFPHPRTQHRPNIP